MKRHALTEAADPSASTLHAVAKDRYASWLETQPEPVRDWLASSRFRADVGTIAWLPGAQKSVLAITSSEPLHALGDLPLRLPEGRYRLASAASDTALSLSLLGWGLGAYRYTRYKRAERAPAELVVPAGVDEKALERELDAVALVRDLINTPANDMLPSDLAAAAESVANEFGARTATVVGDELVAKNFPMIHAVGRASTNAPRLIDLVWGDPAHPKVTLVGKGVCFDSGGLDLKPANGMRLMKKDMGGAAHVLGLARLVMSNALPVRLRVLISAVENAVGGNAFRPGDVIRARSGKTVEIDNTDAEGRLVLCDALALACEERPSALIDYSTLTGAARTALGTELPALFANDDALADGIASAGRSCADPVWRLPLHAPYKKMLDSKVADLANGSSSPYAGAIVAALFLEAFVAAGVPWAHFDIMAWNTATQPGRPEGGEAMGMRAVYAYLAERFGRSGA